MKNALLSAGVAVLAVTPALASDLPVKTAPPPAAVVTEYDWTGAYLGGNLGWVWSHSPFASYSGLIGDWTDNSSTFIGGGQIGYRFVFPSKLAIGAEASLDWNANASSTSTS